MYLDIHFYFHRLWAIDYGIENSLLDFFHRTNSLPNFLVDPESMISFFSWLEHSFVFYLDGEVETFYFVTAMYSIVCNIAYVTHVRV